MKPFGPFTYQGGGIITGPDRFSETVGMTPTHTLVVAQLPTAHQTCGFADDRDRDACGYLMAASSDLLVALKEAVEVIENRMLANGPFAGDEDRIARWRAIITKAEAST